MIIKKEIEIVNEISIQDIYNGFQSEQEALDAILEIDEYVESWNFTISLITKLLSLINQYYGKIGSKCSYGVSKEILEKFKKELKTTGGIFLK